MTGGNARQSRCASLERARLNPEMKRRKTVASVTTQPELVGLIAAEIASGIDDAVGYWLGRVERELLDRGLSPTEQLQAISRVLREYKQVTGKPQITYGLA
jgi:uncharacterized protein YgfB (UPF0149 family)